jgi:hypothetical protein
MTEKLPSASRQGKRYTEEHIRRGLLTLAIHAGNSEDAADTLKQAGLTIPARTLRDWKQCQYPELYREIHDTHGHEIEQALVPELRDTAILAAHGTRRGVEKSIEQLESGQAKDPSTVARNLATVAGISIDKLYLATDRPGLITEHRDAAEILRSLASKVPKAVEGTAVEITTSEITGGVSVPEGAE